MNHTGAVFVSGLRENKDNHTFIKTFLKEFFLSKGMARVRISRLRFHFQSQQAIQLTNKD